MTKWPPFDFDYCRQESAGWLAFHGDEGDMNDLGAGKIVWH